MMKKVSLAILLVSGVLVAGMNQNFHSYSEFDTDGNGKVTKIEFENVQQKNMIANANAGKQMRNAGNAPTFEMVDTNKDGIVDIKEFQVQQQKNMQNNRKNRNMNKGRGMKKQKNRNK